MNEELKQDALRIAEILQEQGNPYQRIEIDADGIKKVSTDAYVSAEAGAKMEDSSKLVFQDVDALIKLSESFAYITGVLKNDLHRAEP
ncbi:hypothetical protein [Lacticaseibacillus paracasei]|uniref:hypothetical protein n=1 Tax=Lacticaseibacillus paracasei TaxID=1597 RepID=UPI00237FCE31|nr:hypothetical protein [Lacticaseibacillus paracasei]MDE3285554.1 hypothetical protein [Lacticaseibacillus paracasei]